MNVQKLEQLKRALADYHQQLWLEALDAVLGVHIEEPDGSVRIPVDALNRWKRQRGMRFTALDPGDQQAWLEAADDNLKQLARILELDLGVLTDILLQGSEFRNNVQRWPQTDGVQRLCYALYGRSPRISDWIGGSRANMLFDAANRIRYREGKSMAPTRLNEGPRPQTKRRRRSKKTGNASTRNLFNAKVAPWEQEDGGKS